MLVHELCGITDEDANRIEMSVINAIGGRSQCDANGIVLKTILESEDCFKEAVYMAFTYGFAVGFYRSK